MAYMTCGMYGDQPPPSSVTLFHFCNIYTKNDTVFVVWVHDFRVICIFIYLIQNPSLVNNMVHLPPPYLLTCTSVFSYAQSQN
jgi:hypothetical protein